MLTANAIQAVADVEKAKAAKRLVAATQMVNQAIGDALSGILMIETILRYYNWSLEKWNSMYKDLPSRQLKVKLDLCNLNSLLLSLGLLTSLQGCPFWNGLAKNFCYS